MANAGKLTRLVIIPSAAGDYSGNGRTSLRQSRYVCPVLSMAVDSGVSVSGGADLRYFGAARGSACPASGMENISDGHRFRDDYANDG
jgi:hypothetical protein